MLTLVAEASILIKRRCIPDMVKIFLYSLLAVLLALFLTLYLDITSDPGYLLIAWRNYTFETSLFALAVLLILAYALWRLLVHFIGWLNPLNLISAGRRYREQRQTRSKTVEGLMHLARSNWQAAYNQLMLGARDKDASVVNYLAAAYAACEMQRKDLWAESLEQALRKHPQAASTINTVRARLLLQTNQLEQSEVVLEQLRKSALNDANLLSMLKEVYIRLEEWGQLRSLLPALVKNAVIGDKEQAQIEKRVFAAELEVAVANLKVNDKSREKILADFRKQWKKLSEEFKDDDNFVAHIANTLLEANARTDAAQIYEARLGRRWSKELIAVYGATDFGDSSQQLIHGEIWLKEHPRDPQLLLALGRICMRNKLWGKARDYFEASLKAFPCADVYGELSRLTAALGDDAASKKYFAQYTELAGKSLPQLPLPGKTH